MAKRKYLVLYQYGHGGERMATVFSGEHEREQDLDPDSQEVKDLIAKSDEMGPVDSSLWDQALGEIGMIAREHARSFRLPEGYE